MVRTVVVVVVVVVVMVAKGPPPLYCGVEKIKIRNMNKERRGQERDGWTTAPGIAQTSGKYVLEDI